MILVEMEYDFNHVFIPAVSGEDSVRLLYGHFKAIPVHVVHMIDYLSIRSMIK